MKYKSFDEYWVIKGQFLPGGATDREIGVSAWNAALKSVEAGQQPTTTVCQNAAETKVGDE